MHETETVERRAAQRQCADPDSVATPALPDHRGADELPSDASGTLSSMIATGSGVAVLCVVEGAWLWLLGTGAFWLLGGR
jgi:hypothetical protein